MTSCIGGSNDSDSGSGIAVDSRGNAYVTGTTFSPDFPTANPLAAPNNALQGTTDAFVAKIGADENLFNATDRPATVTVKDPQPVELGVKFQSSVAGTVTG